MTSVTLLAQTADGAATSLGDVVWWLLAGLAFLWVVAQAAEVTLQKLKPVLMFLVVAAVLGMLVIKAFGAL
ncbi:hypothetical protein [Mycobacteroides abscessus]|uniref:hypothetical protein n=1 Tax=Mycobacteroides abscessus TaxID=36809 RepID=UPI000D8E1EFD|nr:hypothetical protein [Mycobacteroides abscessus]SPX87807.1 Uncharacterised protein [Mycobacteroides abscessus]